MDTDNNIGVQGLSCSPSHTLKRELQPCPIGAHPRPAVTKLLLSCLVPARLAILTGLVLASAAVATAGTREVLPLDDHWRFRQADAPGAEQPGFDDADWKLITVPHDWSIAGPFAETNLAGGAGAFLPGGVAWYRQHFSLPAADLGRRVFVEFDGVVQSSDVWINGRHLGHCANGGGGFRYELPAAALGFGNGANNLLTVCAEASAPAAARGYAGAGIYRHVRLVVTDPVHFATRGVFVSTPKISAREATARIETIVTNESAAPREISVQTVLLAPDGEPVGAMESSHTIAAGAAAAMEQMIAFPNPQAWNLDDPKLCRAVSKLRVEAQLADELITTFGVRDLHFETDTGFRLNGKNFQLQDVWLPADGGAFGVAAPLSIWETRLKTLKSLGVNVIRTAHDPPGSEFLDLCDRLGLLVMSESPCAGQFPWTGIDSLGEARHWPMIGDGSGLLDRAGAIRPLARERQSRWTDTPMVAMARRLAQSGAVPTDPGFGVEARPAPGLVSDWTPPVLKPHTEAVEVYSNCKEVELFLNGKSLGKKGINADASPRIWQAPFVPGVLKAIARNERGRPAATNEWRTAGRPAGLVLATETKTLSPVWDDVAIVRATIVDARGVPIPRADDLISFTVSGPGVIAAVDNADNASHEPFQAQSRHAFQGRCVAFVRAKAAPGRITLTATAAGLGSDSVVINARPAPRTDDH